MPHKDPEAARAYFRKYAAAHREHKRQTWKAWRDKNIETQREKERTRRQTTQHKTRRVQYGREYMQSNREKLAAKSRAYRKKNPQKVAQWRKNRLEKRRVELAAYRAKKRQAPIRDFTAAQWVAMKAQYGYRCVYCGKKTVALTQDHLTPISKGGSHTASNVVPACRSCNSRKHAGPVLKPVQPVLVL